MIKAINVTRQNAFWPLLFVAAVTVPFPSHAQQQRFTHPPDVIAAAQQEERQRERGWRDCFARALAQVPVATATWNDAANVFRNCRAAEISYIRAALRAAQHEYPEPRKDQFGRIIAWDQINNHERTMRRLDWVDIRRELEDSATSALRLPYRCQRQNINNSGTAYHETCILSDMQMGMDTFDFHDAR